ncbi:MAG: DNA alkylation repair protein [Planctomycetota bacterium]
MPGRLRRRRAGGGGLVRESRQTTLLPLMEAAFQEAGLPRPFSLTRDLDLQGYFECSLKQQWELLHGAFLQRVREMADPLDTLAHLGRQPEPMVRFFLPGVAFRLLEDRPREALRTVRSLAGDPEYRVAEAVQAFGVRPCAQALGPDVVAELLDWIHDPSLFLRRAAVEGCRPRGVWVRHLEWACRSPALLLPLLEPLREERERYVANAVGNALNDVSKDHPRLVLDVAGRWLSSPPHGPQTGRMVQKALRTLVKRGDPFALRLFGLEELEVSVRAELLGGPRVAPNSTLVFRLEIQNEGDAGPANLVYEISTAGKHRRRPRRKRFQGGTVRLPAGATLVVTRRERIFDRRAALLLDGPGEAVFFLNGVEVARVPFEVARVP